MPGLDASGAAGNTSKPSKHGRHPGGAANGTPSGGAASGSGAGSAGGGRQAPVIASDPAATHGVGETSTGGTMILLLALTAGGIGAGLVSVRAARRGRPPLSG